MSMVTVRGMGGAGVSSFYECGFELAFGGEVRVLIRYDIYVT